MTRRLSDRERLAVQLYGVTAASVDLRHHSFGKDAPAFRAFVREVREIREHAYRFLPFVSTMDVEWAKHRLAVRLGAQPFRPGHYPAGQRLDEHTQESDLRLLLDWLEATS